MKYDFLLYGKLHCISFAGTDDNSIVIAIQVQAQLTFLQSMHVLLVFQRCCSVGLFKKSNKT